jgi:chromosome segregation ATPase
MYNKTEVNTVKRFAESTILHMQQLVKALDTVEMLADNNESLQAMSNQLSIDLQAAQARISEDESTIHIKDSQLKVAQSDLESVKLDNDTLKQENDRKSVTLKTYEDTITNLQNELEGYRNERRQTESNTGEDK